MSNTLGIVSPWVNYYRELETLFGGDPEIRIEFDQTENEVRLYVENPGKASALTKLLPPVRQYGNVILKVTVIPANGIAEDPADLFQTAFMGNPAFSYARASGGSLGVPDFNYIVFANRVVQYFNDDLSDANGVRSTLYQDIARDVFGEKAGISYCTDVADQALAKPLGEWP